MLLQLIKFFSLLGLFVCVVILLQVSLNAYLTRRAERGTVNRRLKLLQQGISRDKIANLLRPDHAPGREIQHGLLGEFYKRCGRASLPVAPQRMLIGMAVATAALFAMLLALVFGLGREITLGTIMLLGVVALAAGAGLPAMYVARRAQNRAKKMEEQFPTAIDVFTRALRSGHPIASAIELLTTEMADPVGSEFGIVSDEIAYGLDLNESLANFARRWELEDLKMFAVSISVQSETGGNLAEILQNLANVIRDRASLYLKVRALSSEGRMSAWMLSLLPVLTFLVLFLTNPSFYLDVAQDPIFTTTFTALLVLYVLGVLWIRNLVNLKV